MENGETNAGKLAKTIAELMTTAGKTMNKQGTQPRTKKKNAPEKKNMPT